MLPVVKIQEQIIAHLRQSSRLVLTAPTGSGKTTQVPQIVWRSGLIDRDRQIIVLQPRRLATRMVAGRVAREMSVQLGELVGYQTRHDSAVSNATRIRFMTEGLLLRLLRDDPTLKHAGCVILDEFHERNLAADISLGLVRRLQESARDDLKLVVMSATLDADRVAQFLGCQLLQASGRLYPVDVSHLPRPPNPLREPVWDLAAAALESVLHDAHGDRSARGDVLIFMPGVYEIGRTIEACRRRLGNNADSLRFLPLHGTLPAKQQDAALEPSDARKVIVATNVAETSLTIEGLRYVIDSGVARIHRYDVQRGLNALRVEPISKASADQRAGRAGRTAPGMCLRLWTARDHGARADHESPEIQRLELSEAVLTLKSMGIADVASFSWLQSPESSALVRADALLHDLGALDDRGDITETGKTMSEFPAHPRLARMMLDAASRGCLRRAVTWAAIISEREMFNQPRRQVMLRYVEQVETLSDLAARERALSDLQRSDFDLRRCKQLGANALACRDVRRTAAQFARVCRHLRLSMDGPNRTDDLIKSLLIPFRDHLAMKIDRERPNCSMPGRRKVVLDRESVVESAGPLVALEVREIGRGDTAQTMLSLASQVETAWLEEIDPAGFETSSELAWNASQLAVEAIEKRAYRGLVLEQTARPPRDPHVAAGMIVDRIISRELRLDNWNDKVEQWIMRARCVATWFPDRTLIAYDDDDIKVLLHEIVGSATRFRQVRDKPCLDAVRHAMSWDDQQFVERMAPESIRLPRGKAMKIEYTLDAPPRGRAKIQELYDLDDTPRLAGGRHPLLIEILGPNSRPVQITSDLRGFWQNLYPELKKELKRRYPKHEWR